MGCVVVCSSVKCGGIVIVKIQLVVIEVVMLYGLCYKWGGVGWSGLEWS